MQCCKTDNPGCEGWAPLRGVSNAAGSREVEIPALELVLARSEEGTSSTLLFREVSQG